MHNDAVLIRRENPADIPAIRAVVTAAFTKADRPGSAEAALVDALRADPGWIPALSLVADDAGVVVGHVVCTWGRVDSRPVLGLGPLAVLPSHQGRGVGKALVHAALGACDARDEPMVVLLGSPSYYGRFGFRNSLEVGVVAPDPDWEPYFQVRTLSAYDGTPHGTFRYAAPFDDL